MAVPITFEASSRENSSALWNWLSGASAKSENERRNNIKTLHSRARVKFKRLKQYPADSQRGITMAEWNRVLDDLEDGPIDALLEFDVCDELTEMIAGIDDTLRTEKDEADEAASAASSSSSGSSSSSSSRSRPATMKDDELAALSLHYKPSRTTSAMPVRSVPRAPSTPAQVWADAQVSMGSHCDEVVPQVNPNSHVVGAYGDHAVNQASVLALLPVITGATVKWRQGRPAGAGAEVRIMVAFDTTSGDPMATLWTNGVSHDDSRRNGTYAIYRRQGNTSSFVRTSLSAIKHPMEP